MKNLLKFSLFAIIFAIFTFSCDKVTAPDQATGKDVHVGELAVSDVFTFTNSDTDDGGKSALADSACYSRKTVQNTDGTFTTTLTFSDSCTLSDGVVRSGEIIINWEYGWRVDSTKQATITFNEFSRDSNVISGKITIKLESRVLLKYSMTENGMKVTLSTGEEVTWSGTRTIQWSEGFITPRDRYDDVVTVNFTREGVNRNGESFIAEGKDLEITSTCDDGKMRITSGTIEITNITNNNSITTVEFNGCSDSFTVNGVEVNP